MPAPTKIEPTTMPTATLPFRNSALVSDGLAGLRPQHLPLSEVFRFFPCNA